MDPAVAAFALVPGLALGSFLNVAAARLPEERSIVRPRSACGACAAPIAW
jgi:leader peptidase (prepilin peptidase)/N-methyltransferase